MKASIAWLREVAELPADATAEQLLDDLVRVGLENEAVHCFEVSGPVVVGEVLERTPEPQTNGKTINWCRVRVAPEGQPAADGGEDVRGIVCGAHNFEAGDKVVVTLPGSELPGGFRIAARKTYGHISDGMIASVRELGIGDDHEGILVLSSLGLDPEAGTDAKALLGLDETAIEVNVTPDRGYAMSIRGLGREYGHATGASYRDPAAREELAAIAAEAIAADPAAVRVPVRIAEDRSVRDQDACSVFAGLVVTGVDPARPTPPWMTARLLLAGVRPLGLLIDITNYVMLELGQPIHGYDLDQLRGGIVVRRAEQGERLTTLDGKDRELSAEDILICDDRGPIGLAGVMGGAETELGPGTRNVYIEAASFSPVSIARTARRHKLPSEASRRFERGVDPRVALPAAARVAELMSELAGGTIQPAGTLHERIQEPRPIELAEDAAQRLMGVEYAPDEVTGALRAIGCEVQQAAPGRLSVTPPSWRPDLSEPVTLIEEIARLRDFERIPSILPTPGAGRGLTREQRLRRQLADALAAAGSVEVLSYPFTTQEDNDRFGAPHAPGSGHVPAVKLANPLDAKTGWMRTSMLPGLLGVARRNHSRGLTDLSIFEAGHVFLPREDGEHGVAELPATAAEPSARERVQLDASLPAQPRRLGALLLGDRVPKQPGTPAEPYGWQDALQLAALAGHAIACEIRVRQGSHQAFHPGRCAELYALGEAGEAVPLGYAGELHPQLTEDADLPRVVAAVELDIDRALQLARREVRPRVIAAVPAATQDLSLVVARDVPADEVLRTVTEGAGELLEEIRLVDDYRGSGVNEAEKSLTFALRFRAADRTLTAAEASQARDAGAALAAERHGAAIRA